jgi:hypothetical protein
LNSGSNNYIPQSTPSAYTIPASSNSASNQYIPHSAPSTSNGYGASNLIAPQSVVASAGSNAYSWANSANSNSGNTHQAVANSYSNGAANHVKS